MPPKRQRVAQPQLLNTSQALEKILHDDDSDDGDFDEMETSDLDEDEPYMARILDFQSDAGKLTIFCLSFYFQFYLIIHENKTLFPCSASWMLVNSS